MGDIRYLYLLQIGASNRSDPPPPYTTHCFSLLFSLCYGFIAQPIPTRADPGIQFWRELCIPSLIWPCHPSPHFLVWICALFLTQLLKGTKRRHLIISLRLYNFSLFGLGKKLASNFWSGFGGVTCPYASFRYISTSSVSLYFLKAMLITWTN